MNDLTEQWKKGELPSRDDDHLWLAYYIKHKDGYIHADSLWRGHWGTADRNSIEQILAPVPSYDEWQAKLEENAQLKERVSKLEKMQYSYTPEEWNTMLRTVNRTKEQNAQLKELLKECERQFEEVELCRYDVADTDQEDWFKISTEQAGAANKMLAKINEALR